MVHLCRRADLRGYRVSCAARSEHHGLRPGAIQLLYRAALRHGDPGHAVEAHDEGGRLLGIAGGHLHGDRALSVGALRSLSAALRSALTRRENAGGGYVSGAVVVVGVRNCNRGGELCNKAEAGVRTGGAGVRRGSATGGARRSLVPEACRMGGNDRRAVCHSQLYFLVSGGSMREEISIWFFGGVLFLAYGV